MWVGKLGIGSWLIVTIRGMILFTQMEKIEIYYMNFNLIRLCSILKACIGRREKCECYRSLFAIKVEKGTFD